MKLFSISQAPMFQASDGTLLREIFHPRHTGLDLPYSIAHALLMPGEASETHALTFSGETYIFLSGEGRLHIGDEEADVKSGDIAHIPATAAQWLENTGEEPLVFLCVVSPPWSASDEVIP